MPSPPSSPGFSVAEAGARLGEGLAGIYEKSEYKPLVQSTTGNPFVTLPALSSEILGAYGNAGAPFSTMTNGILFGFEVKCPSSRIRVSFGVGALAPFPEQTGNAERESLIPFSTGFGFVNVFPGTKIKNITATQDAFNSGDNTEVISGQAIYPYILASKGDDLFDPRDLISGGYDGTAANSGGKATSNGEGLPFAYEAISNATNYRVVGATLTSLAGDKVIAPIYAWARWEIVDPRSEADSIALLARCELNVNPPQKFA
jgi:hypothetical protein